MSGGRCAAVSVVIDWQGRVLCVWNRRYGGWALPGGLVEEGETPEEGQRRELYEETGLKTLHALLVFKAPHNIKAQAGAARPGRASIVCLYVVDAEGEPRQGEEDCPIAWKTIDEFLVGSPFRELYAPILPGIVAAAIARRTIVPS